MKRYIGLWLMVTLFAGSSVSVVAQASANGVTPPPKVLVIFREFVKPGKSGSLHQKTESAFVQAMTAAKWPTHYLAMDSMSGRPRTLFLTAYDSFDAWEKDNKATEKNATLSAALDRAAIADGDLLASADGGVFTYREDYSLRPNVNIAQYRYFEISRFVVRQGHERDWDALVKIYIDGYGKATQNVRWATYSSQYGQENGGLYIVLTPLKSLAEVDGEMAEGKQFEAQLGDDGMKRVAELTAACIQSTETNLFSFSPKISYVSDAWVKTDPGFWKPKPAAATAKKPEAKPAQ